MHTDQPATPYFLLLYGGEFRDGDFTEHLANMVKDKTLAVVIDKRVGAYLHDTSVPEVLAWVVSLAKDALCLGIIASPVCGPWCALRGQGHGPGVLFSTLFPDGKRDAHGRVIAGAAEVIKGLDNMCTVLLAGHSHGAGVLVEHPVSRRKGSRFAIPGRELHSTMWDTSVLIALNEVMQFTSICGDLCPPPLNGSSQKTTNWMATRHWVLPVSKRLNKICSHPAGTHKTLRSEADATTIFATAETGVYSSGLCKELVLVALEGASASMKSAVGPTLYVNVHAVSGLSGGVKHLAGMVAKMSKMSPTVRAPVSAIRALAYGLADLFVCCLTRAPMRTSFLRGALSSSLWHRM
jgi:hypothetical protein